MSGLSEQETLLIAYLLGRLPAERQEELEERFLADDELHEELLATADDLIHAYLAQTLPVEDRRSFEAHFLASPRRRERLDFIRGLLVAVERVPARPAGGAAPGWRRAAIAAGLLAALAAALVWSFRSSVDPGRASRSPAPSSRVSAPSEAGGGAIPTPSPEAVRTVRLPRDPGPALEIPLPSTVRAVRLEVALGEQRHPSYDAVVRDARGKEVWRIEGAMPDGPEAPLVLEVPVEALGEGERTLAVAGEQLRDGSAGAPFRRRFKVHVVRHR